MTPTPDVPAGEDRRSRAIRHIAPAILVKVRIYLIVFSLVAIAAIVDAFRGTAWTWVFVSIGLLVGIAIGVVASRMQQFSWNKFETKVVGKFDAIGVVVLIFYVVFAIFRSRIIGVWIPVVHVSAASLAVLAGVMLGQVLGIRRGLRKLARRMRRTEVVTPERDR